MRRLLFLLPLREGGRGRGAPVAALLFGVVAALGAPRLYAGDGDALSVSLLTFSPGEVYWQRFGHNALLVRDQRTGRALAYNYGLFDFEQENFFLNFARGRMRYRLGVFELHPMLAAYRDEGRGVIEQQLDLTGPQRVALDRFLRWNAQPDNADYAYDYFRDNCSTRVRDALDQALGGALRRGLAGRPAGITYRSESVRLLWPDRWLALGMDLGLGPASDRQLDLWDAAFSPVILMQALRGLAAPRADGGERPLAAREAELFAPALPDPPAQAPSLLPPFLAAGVLAAGALLALGYAGAGAARVLRAAAGGFLLVCGLAGLVSACLWALTAHWAGWRNPILLVLSPLCLLLVPAWWRAGEPRRAWHRALALLILAMAAAAAPVALTDPGAAKAHWIALLLPLHAALTWLLLLRRRQAQANSGTIRARDE